MTMRWMAAATLLVACVTGATVAFGDVIITLKNGVQITVPVKNEDIANITFGGDGAPVASGAPAASNVPAQLAAPPVDPRRQNSKSANNPYEQQPIDFEKVVKATNTGKGLGLPGGSEFISEPTSSMEGQEVAMSGRVYTVGKDKEFSRPSEVAGMLQPGDVVEIDGGVYLDDNVVWMANGITLRGVNGRPHLRSTQAIPNRKAIWVIRGDKVIVDNIEFSGATVQDKNGAGIRAEGGRLLIKNSYFHHNQFALLSANKLETEVTIENSEFGYSFRAGTWAHGIYIGVNRKFTIRDSYLHHSHRGHHLKSNALENYVLYNRISDEDGVSSYGVEIQKCGLAYIVGNVFHQGPGAENHTAISYSSKGKQCDPQRTNMFYVVNNTFYNEKGMGNFIRNSAAIEPLVMNNLVIGRANLCEGKCDNKDNLFVDTSEVVDARAYDFRLKPGSKAIDAGEKPGRIGLFDLTPKEEYKHPMNSEARPKRGALDIGAYEYNGG